MFFFSFLFFGPCPYLLTSFNSTSFIWCHIFLLHPGPQLCQNLWGIYHVSMVLSIHFLEPQLTWVPSGSRVSWLDQTLTIFLLSQIWEAICPGFSGQQRAPGGCIVVTYGLNYPLNLNPLEILCFNENINFWKTCYSFLHQMPLMTTASWEFP